MAVIRSNKRYIYVMAKSRQACPRCHVTRPDKRAYATCTFELQTGIWREQEFFCQQCFSHSLAQKLTHEMRQAEYTIAFVETRNRPLPAWIKVDLT